MGGISRLPISAGGKIYTSSSLQQAHIPDPFSLGRDKGLYLI